MLTESSDEATHRAPDRVEREALPLVLAPVGDHVIVREEEGEVCVEECPRVQPAGRARRRCLALRWGPMPEKPRTGASRWSAMWSYRCPISRPPAAVERPKTKGGGRRHGSVLSAQCLSVQCSVLSVSVCVCHTTVPHDLELSRGARSLSPAPVFFRNIR